MAKAVNTYPVISKPIDNRPVTFIAYRDVAVNDAVSFQWKFKASGQSNYADIPGANGATYQIDKFVSATHKGEYKCEITFKDGTTADTAAPASAAGDSVRQPANAVTSKYHNAPKIYRGPWVRTHVHWKDIEALKALVADTANDTVSKFQTKLLANTKLTYIYDLINRYGNVKMVDSRNGYTYNITEKTCNTAPMTVEGPFKNFWQAP